MRKMNLFLLTMLLVVLSTLAFGQTTVLSETFSGTDTAYLSSTAITGTVFSAKVSGVDWGVGVISNVLNLTNDASTTANVQGWSLAYNTNALSSPYNTTLASNSGLVTWTFNMRQPRPDPAGFGISSYGLAFILAGSSTSANTTGSGYAVALGQSGTTDPVRLLKYNNGLQGTITNIITSNTTGLTDFGAEYLSVKVTYNPTNGQWELFLRNDGTTAFADPLTGSLVTQGTATDATYTGTALTCMGPYWQGSTAATLFASFDNIVVTVGAGSISEPTAQPTVLSFNTVTSSSFNVSFTPASVPPAGYIAIRKTGSAPTTDPTDNTAYAVNDVLGDGTVVFNGSGTSFSQTSLTASTTYYYKIYSYNGSGATANYLQTGPLSGSQATSATATPIITLSTAALSGFTYVLGAGPSTTQTFTVGGSNLTTDISIAASTNYEISKSISSGYATPLTFTNVGGAVSTTTVYVRLKAGLAVADYNSELITASTTGATNQTVTCNGTVTAGASAPAAPLATAAGSITDTGFSANWNVSSGATSYRLDAYTGSASGSTTDLFISEYVEGSSNNKAIEIFNGTGATVDLVNYSLKKQVNGAGAYGNELILNGSLANNDVYVIVYSATSGSLKDEPYVDYSTTLGAMSFNGNDAIALYHSGTQIDAVGVFNQVTPNWGADITLVRKSSITSPAITYSVSDWDSYPVDTFTYLGSHSLARTITYVPGFQDLNVGNVQTYPVTGLTANTTYHYVVRASNATGTSSNSNVIDATTTGAALAAEPTAQPTVIGFSSVTSSSFTVAYTAASPTAAGYLAVRKLGSTPTTDPSDGNAYTAGTTLGDGTVVYSGSAVTFPQTGLATSSTYYYKIYSYNGSSTTTNYLVTSPLAGNQTTSSVIVAPSVITTSVTAVTQTTATGGGNVTADGGATVTARGVCWNTGGTPVVTDAHTTDASGTGIFTSSITGLTANTLYHVRAYATNSINTSYGSDVTFTTLAVAPIAPVATAASSVNNSSFVANWNVSSGATSYRFDLSTSNAFGTFVNGYNDLIVAGNSQSVTGLSASTTYFYRVRAVNTGGTSASSNVITQATTATDPFGGYYSTVAGLSGSALKAGLHTKIKATHTTQFGYSDLETQMKITDEDPNNSNNVLELYTGWSVPKSSYGGAVTNWNKEHVWSKSHGFSEAAPAGSDLHHLRPCDATVNSAKNNRDFDEATTPYVDASPYGSYSGDTGCSETGSTIWEPRDVEKGDVARMIFYMAVRYEADDPYNLEMVDYTNSSPNGEPLYGKLSTLLAWAASDPPDAWEALRNNRIQALQGNRNPFIDHPEYVASIWGGGASVPIVATTAITAIGTITATGGGNVSNDGGATVNARGVCWNTTGTPVATDSHTTNSTGTGVFTSSLTGLTANTLYYVRAYATNSIGTAYGDPVTFTTLKAEPTAHVTGFATGTVTSATIPLTWTDAAGTDTYLIKGNNVSFASITAPADGTSEADGALVHNVAQGTQTYTFTGLTAATTYYFKIFPYTNTGTNVNYKTDGTIPQVSAATAAIVPAITVTPPTMTFSSNVGVTSAPQTATVASNDLGTTISVTSAGPFTFCLTSGGTYTNPLTLAQNYNGSVYIKFTPPAATTYTDVINFTSGTTSDTIVPSATGTTVSSSLLLVENFDYPATDLLTAHGWTNHSGTSNFIPVSATGLTYSGYPAVGGSASLLATGEDVNRTFTAQTSGSVYASLLINVTSSQTTGDYIVHFGTNLWSTNFYARLFVKKDASTTNFALGLNKGTSAATIYTGYNYVPGTTYLVVLKYTFVDGAANDEVSLIINPAITGSEPVANLTLGTADTFADATNIGGIALRQGNASNAAVALIDGIRIANAWALLFPSGTPEITVTSSFTAFNTVAGNPSTSQSYTVSGNNLVGNIGIQAPSGYELSTTNAAPWTSTLSLAPGSRGTVYVRLNSVTPGDYSGSLIHTSNGATAVNRTVTGTVSAPAGSITIVQSLTQFSTFTGTASSIQSYTLTGADLTGTSLDIASMTTSGATFQIRAAEGDGVWQTSLSLLPTFDGLIEVRFNPTIAGTYNGTLTHYSDGVADVVVDVSGIANDPTPVLSVLPTTMSFSANSGTTSAAQSCTVTSANLSLPIDIASTGHYTFSTTETGTYSNPLQVAATFNSSIWIKFSPASIGIVNNSITFTSGTHTASISTTGNGVDPSNPVATDLFISEYVEGTSYNKAIEIFNGTGVAVDLSAYTLKKQTNGAGLFGSDLILSGTLANNDCYVIVSNATGGTNLATQPYVDLATNSQVVNFSGNDAVALYHNGIQTDVVGIVDQVANWGLDMTLVRNSYVVSPTIAFSFTDWTQYATNTFSNLGVHTFLPGLSPADAPTILPASGVKTAPVMVSMSSPTTGAQIRYTTNGTDPTETSTLYASAFEISVTTTVKAKTFATGYAPSAITTATYIYPTNVTNIAALRALTPDTGAYYKLTGQAVLTLKSPAYFGTKYIQDATGAILVYDAAGKITTSYNLGDGITNIVGQLQLYNGMLELIPTVDPGAATSTGNVITPQLITLSQLSAHQAELVRIADVSFTTTGTFTTATNYTVQDLSGTGIVRAQYSDLDYVGTALPTTPKTIVGVVLQRTLAEADFIPRSLAEFTDGTPPVAPVNVVVTRVGNDIVLTWDNDPTVTSWNVYTSEVSATTGFGTVPTVTVTTHSCTFINEVFNYNNRFFKVTANR